MIEAGRITARDHRVIMLLGEHRVMSAEQLARMAFPNIDRARHRLLVLFERGVLDRFHRIHTHPGERPWFYTLGWLGALIHTAAHDNPNIALPKPNDTARQTLRLQRSPALAHLLGVNEFFTRLHAAARHQPGVALNTWWPEARAAEACGHIVRPDGYGEWTEHTATSPSAGRVQAEFFYEHDTGTERLATLLGKIDKYARLATAGIGAAVLLRLPGTRREERLHHAIAEHYGPAGPTVVFATTTAAHLAPSPPHQGQDPAHRGEPPNPAGAIWRPIGATTHRRVRLAGLAEHTQRRNN